MYQKLIIVKALSTRYIHILWVHIFVLTGYISLPRALKEKILNQIIKCLNQIISEINLIIWAFVHFKLDFIIKFQEKNLNLNRDLNSDLQMAGSVMDHIAK